MYLLRVEVQDWLPLVVWFGDQEVVVEGLFFCPVCPEGNTMFLTSSK